MTFMEAVEAMKQGKKVQREGWDPNVYVRTVQDGLDSENYLCLFEWDGEMEEEMGIRAMISVEDIEATDWQVAG